VHNIYSIPLDCFYAWICPDVSLLVQMSLEDVCIVQLDVCILSFPFQVCLMALYFGKVTRTQNVFAELFMASLLLSLDSSISMSMCTIYLYLDTAIGCPLCCPSWTLLNCFSGCVFFALVAEKGQLAVDAYACEIPSLLKLIGLVATCVQKPGKKCCWLKEVLFPHGVSGFLYFALATGDAESAVSKLCATAFLRNFF